MPRTLKLLPTFALVSLISPCVNSAFARQAPEARDPEFDFGVSLYKLGDYRGAARASRLRRRPDPDARAFV